VDIAAPWTYVLAEVDGGMLPNTWNADQQRKYLYMIKEAQFSLPIRLTLHLAKT
jgi:hypothetical protein